MPNTYDFDTFYTHEQGPWETPREYLGATCNEEPYEAKQGYINSAVC